MVAEKDSVFKIKDVISMHVDLSLLKRVPWIGYASIAVLFAFAGYLVWTHWGDGNPRRLTRAYYTNDEGQTWFADDISRAIPFDKDGKPAYRAYIFRCHGKTRCGFLGRYTEGLRKAAAEYNAQNPGKALPVGMITRGSREFRKPGPGNAWVSELATQQLESIVPQPCPDGGTSEPVVP